MRIISRKTLRAFWQKPGREDAEQPLKAWFHEAQHAEWPSPTAVKALYRSASVLKGSRVVFNIGGNKYRLVVKIHYRYRIVYIRFVGTHSEYDKIDALEV